MASRQSVAPHSGPHREPRTVLLLGSSRRARDGTGSRLLLQSGVVDGQYVAQLFKAIKQSLRIKTFIGTSENAVRMQIWTALIAMVVLRYLQLRSTWNWSLSNLVALLRYQLFVYRDLWSWINQPFRPPVDLDDGQMSLALNP
jgi:hypothetical protein